jgi:hypothetical protein
MFVYKAKVAVFPLRTIQDTEMQYGHQAELFNITPVGKQRTAARL